MATKYSSPSGIAKAGPWKAITRAALAVGIVTTIAFAVVASGWTTSSDSQFLYTADYWYTALGLPLAIVGLVLGLGVYRLQTGRTGRRGTVGVWINSICCVELFVQVLVSLITTSEVRWGPAYPLAALGTVLGLGLLAAGSWSVGMFPRWLLAVWPVAWILGSFFAMGATPLLLTVFYVAFWVTLTRIPDDRLSAQA